MYYAIQIKEQDFMRGSCISSRNKEVLLEKARFETFGDLIRHLNDMYLRTEWHRKRFTILGIEEQ